MEWFKTFLYAIYNIFNCFDNIDLTNHISSSWALYSVYPVSGSCPLKKRYPGIKNFVYSS